MWWTMCEGERVRDPRRGSLHVTLVPCHHSVTDDIFYNESDYLIDIGASSLASHAHEPAWRKWDGRSAMGGGNMRSFAKHGGNVLRNGAGLQEEELRVKMRQSRERLQAAASQGVLFIAAIAAIAASQGVVVYNDCLFMRMLR